MSNEQSMEQTAHSRTRVPTGINGLDAIIDGGLPRGGVTVVLGGAGAGKTIFGMQVLASGARDGHEPGILIAFEETAARIRANMTGFAWASDVEEGGDVHLLDAQLSQSVEKSGEFDLVGLLATVGAMAKHVGARRIVFDGLDVLLGYLGDPALVRREIFRLREWVHASDITALVTAKVDARSELADDYDSLQFIADCVVTLHHRVVEGTAARFIRVAKYRGAAHSANEFPMTITSAGLEVAASTTIELTHPASHERVSTGVERLDAMLGGGYYRGSSVLITGVPGTAKTSLAAAFAEAAARRGERTLYVSFDESPDQIVRNVASIGIQLAPLIASGALSIHAFRGRAESAEAHVARVRALLRDRKPQHIVVDPMSALSQRGGDSDAAALQVLDQAKSLGITLVGTSLLGNTLPLAEQTPLNISTIADTWMHVSYVSQGGERNRALTIIKARGTAHSNQVRELVLSSTGVTLADVYAVGGEVLMGTLRWEKENEARRARASAQTIATLREQKAELAVATTDAHMATLARERAVQQAELQHIKANAAVESGHRDSEASELLHRRQADPSSTTSAGSGPAEVGSQS